MSGAGKTGTDSANSSGSKKLEAAGGASKKSMLPKLGGFKKDASGAEKDEKAAQEQLGDVLGEISQSIKGEEFGLSLLDEEISSIFDSGKDKKKTIGSKAPEPEKDFRRSEEGDFDSEDVTAVFDRLGKYAVSKSADLVSMNPDREPPVDKKGDSGIPGVAPIKQFGTALGNSEQSSGAVAPFISPEPKAQAAVKSPILTDALNNEDLLSADQNILDYENIKEDAFSAVLSRESGSVTDDGNKEEDSSLSKKHVENSVANIEPPGTHMESSPERESVEDEDALHEMQFGDTLPGEVRKSSLRGYEIFGADGNGLLEGSEEDDALGETNPKVPSYSEIDKSGSEVSRQDGQSGLEGMDEQAQFEAILASMTPRERAEYEAHAARQEAEAIEARLAKQRDLLERVQASTTNTDHSFPVGLVVGVIVGVVVLVVVIVMIVGSGNEKALPDRPAPVAVVPDSLPPLDEEELPTYPVSIVLGGADYIFVNGVKVTNGKYEFVKGRRNSIFAYADRMTPYFKTFEANEKIPDKIEINLERDTLYAKGQLKFELPKEIGDDVSATLDGRRLNNFPIPVSNVALGFPHILVVESPGFEPHMHIVWPDSDETLVVIPEMKRAGTTRGVTDCSIKKFPQSSKPYTLKIETGLTSFNTPIIVSMNPGGMIEYSVIREQRKPLHVAVIPKGHGTLSLDTSLNHDSTGEVVLSFITDRNHPGLYSCLRRPGEVVCPSMKGDSTIPSGVEWEVIGVTGEQNPSVLRGTQMESFNKGYRYVLEIGMDSRQHFFMKKKGVSKVSPKK